MPSLKLGFALEGNSDYPVIPILARRIVTEQFPAIELAPDATRRPRKRGHGFIKELPVFARQLYDDGAAIVVAVVDTDNTRLGERRGLLHEAQAKCGIPICIAEGLAVRSLEAWLLADARAIDTVFDGDLARVQFPNPETDLTPKETLNQIVRSLTNGREVTFATFACELAEAIRLDVLRQRCPQFDEFVRNLIKCVKEWQRIEASPAPVAKLADPLFFPRPPRYDGQGVEAKHASRPTLPS
jgi:hypothetical protein